MKRVRINIPFTDKVTKKDYDTGDELNMTEERIAEIRTVGINLISVLGDVEEEPESDPEDLKEPESDPEDLKEPESDPEDPKEPESDPEDPKEPESDPEDPKEPESDPGAPKEPEKPKNTRARKKEE